MIQPAAYFARSLRLAAILVSLASPAALAQDMPANHPPATTMRADDAKSPDSKSADSGKSEAKSEASQLPPASVTHHTIKVAGVPLDYTAEAGTHCPPRLRRQDGGERLLCRLYARPEEHQAPDHLRLQRRPWRCRDLSSSRRHRPARGRGQRQGRAARPAARSRRQSEHLARHDRPRLRRSRRHRLQPRERGEGRGEVLGHRAGHRCACATSFAFISSNRRGCCRRSSSWARAMAASAPPRLPARYKRAARTRRAASC